MILHTITPDVGVMDQVLILGWYLDYMLKTY